MKNHTVDVWTQWPSKKFLLRSLLYISGGIKVLRDGARNYKAQKIKKIKTTRLDLNQRLKWTFWHFKCEENNWEKWLCVWIHYKWCIKPLIDIYSESSVVFTSRWILSSSFCMLYALHPYANSSCMQHVIMYSICHIFQILHTVHCLIWCHWQRAMHI